MSCRPRVPIRRLLAARGTNGEGLQPVFAEPEKRAYPIEDKARARNAKARASQQVKGGKMSKAEERKIDKKADGVLEK